MEPLSFPEFRRRLLTLYDPPLRAAATRQRMAQLCGLLEDAGVQSTADLTTTRMAEFVQARSRAVAVNTVVGEIGYLRALRLRRR